MIRRHFLGFLFVFLFVAPAWSVMFAQAQGGTITTFSTGTAEHTVTASGGQYTPIGFELERNTTVNSALFFVKPGAAGSSPGVLEIDANQDGVPEWSFNSTGYGDFGQQTVFASGNATETLFIDPNQGANSNPNSPSFYLPTAAVASSTALEVGFSPTLSGGFFQTGYIDDVAKGDVNNDSKVDFALLSRAATVPGGNATSPTNTTATAFRIVTYSNASGITMSPWQVTCANATRMHLADIDGDNYDDVVGYAPADDKLCIHFTNSTTGGFFPQFNYTHPTSVIDLDFDDFDGDGFDDMVSIRSGGKVHVDYYDSRINTFRNLDSTTVIPSGSATAVSLSHMHLARFDGVMNNPSLVAARNTGDAYRLIWSASQNSIVLLAGSISGVSQDSIVGDFDGDQDLDILASTATGFRSIENQGVQGWDGDNYNYAILDLKNTTILDYDLDGAAHWLVPDSGTVDGNPLTPTGDVTAYPFGSSGNNDNYIGSASIVLEPYTSPRDIHFGDMDGDGSIEQLILAGEGAQQGIFISAHHRVGFDLDKDGVNDVSGEGYAGNGSNGLSMLTVQDTSGNFTSTLNVLTPGLPYTTDAYGIQMSPVNLTMSSITKGTFTFSNLEVDYTANFVVSNNPSITANLSNVLNQQMTPGNGKFNVSLDFMTTRNGSFVLNNPVITYSDGAPNIALPPTPVLKLTDLDPGLVVFDWQPITDFGSDLLDFVVYRSPTGQPVDIQNPYTNTFANNSMDTNVQPGQSWTYWVISVHEFGVTSNLSAPLSVTIPYPAPKSFIPNLTAMDVPEDDGGAMQINWTSGDVSIVQHHLFVLPYEFTDVAGLTTVLMADANATSIVAQTDSNGSSLVDGMAYYVAAIGLDEYGNASTNVSALGPVYTRNDTSLITTLEVAYTDFTQGAFEGTILLARNKGLDVHALLHQNGSPIPEAPLVLTINGSDETFSVEMTTNQTGHALLSLDALASLGPIDAVGNMTLAVSYNGSDGDEQQQPLLGITTTHSAFGTVVVSMTPDPLVPISPDGAFETLVAVDTEEPTQKALLANMNANWRTTDAAGNEVDNGTAQYIGSELSISGVAAYDGHLHVSLDDNPPVYYLPGMLVSTSFASAPVVVENETNTTNETNETPEPVFPDETLPGTVTCGTATYAWEDNGTDDSISCTITNPNPFDVTLGFSWKVIPTTPPPLSFVEAWLTDTEPTLRIPANGSIQVEFSPIRNGPSDGLYPGIQGVGYVFTFACLDDETGRCDGMTTPTATTEGELVWTLGAMPVSVLDDEPLPTDQTSGAMTSVLVGIGLVIAIVAGIAGVLYMRRQGDVDFDEDLDDEDEDYFEQALSAPASTGRNPEVNLSASKSLDELRDAGKTLHTDAPEGLAATPTLGSSADAFEFGATAEDTTTDEATEEEAWEEEASEEDDGITVDENGTEWWQDEDETWWYREEGWEDWAVWEE